MHDLIANDALTGPAIEYRTTSARCPACVTAMPLDDERPKTGTVQWEIITTPRQLRIGVAVDFECPNGHSALDDGRLLKAFHSRRF